MKLMVVGHAQHGKDTVCEIIRAEYGLQFESSSYFAAEKAVRPWLAAKGITYDSFEAMYADRVNHRPEWKQAIRAYNTPYLTKLGRELYAKFDIYCGIRDIDEFLALKRERVFHASFWVDATMRMPPEPESSNQIRMQDADFVIDNNGTLQQLKRQVHLAMHMAQPTVDLLSQV